jgi:hypothetical protein
MVSTTLRRTDSNPPPSSSYTESVDRLGSTAAPLLAGFAITLLGLVVSDLGSFRWPDPTLAVLTLAAVLLILSMQLFITGRQYHLSYEEFVTYTPEMRDSDRQTAHKAANALYRKWIFRSRLSFNAGLVLLLLATAGVLLPPGKNVTIGHDAGRWIAAAIALGACVGEAIWIAAGEWSSSRWNRGVRREVASRALRRESDNA